MQDSKHTNDKGSTYEVFGRDHLERPLQHLGTVRAENHLLAKARARYIYSERPWVEMCLAPTLGFSDCLVAGDAKADNGIGIA